MHAYNYEIKLQHTIYGKTFEENIFRDFHNFSLNRKAFLTNRGLINQQCKSTSML